MEFAPLDSDGHDGNGRRERNGHGLGNGHGHGLDPEFAEALARTVAHLAAQLTVAQLRLRALATHLEARGDADPDAVAAHLALLADREGGAVLRENLGPALEAVIDVDDLERQLVAQLGGG